MDTITTTISSAYYTITLPSGGQGQLIVSATAGDVGIMVGLGICGVLLAALLIHQISREGAAKWLR